MISRIHNKLGTAGFVLAIVALIMALGGAAFAAKGGGLTGKQKKQVKSIANSQAKKYANSNPGAPGPQGPQGITGPQGPKGDAGNPGSNGTDGKSVVTTPITTAGLEGKCVGVGGTRVQVEGSATKEYVCNGKDAPVGGTMTGAWGTGTVLAATGSGPVLLDTRPVVISFPSPLASKPTVVWMKKDETESYFGEASKCTGTAAEPTAAAGFLCVYTTRISKQSQEVSNPINVNEFAGSSAEVTRFGLVNFLLFETEGFALGTWAVTP